MDICDAESLNSFITYHKINAVINCAAYTAVDRAEENIEIANRVNSTGVYNLIEALDKANGRFIISQQIMSLMAIIQFHIKNQIQ